MKRISLHGQKQEKCDFAGKWRNKKCDFAGKRPYKKCDFGSGHYLADGDISQND